MEKSTSSSVNVPTAGTASMLVETVADLMSMYMQTGYLNDLSVFSDLCLSLAKGIDHAVANNEVPLRSHELPSLLKQVYKYRNDFSIQEASMVLLMYVKSACKVGWFRNEDADDLLKLIQEVSRYFSSAEDVDVEPSYVHPYVSRVLPRFCPKPKMDRIIAAFQIKPGFGAFHTGFNIIRGMFSPGMEDILLLVTNVDNMETSSCMIAPPETSFLLNGNRLEGTTNVSIDCMLQFPSVITKMLKYGVNLLQVIGQFDGHYIVVIGTMNSLPSQESEGCSRAPCLAHSDLEIVETSSRVSLHWPISNSCQVSNQAGDKFVDIITAANGFRKPILQDDSNPSQIYSKSQSIKQLTHENNYSVDPPTLDKIQMQNQPRIVVHASIQVTSVKTNAPASYSQQPQRAFLVPSHLATCGER
ncbi:E4 SUMO-protein ligase PIAL2-like [Solanum stenotomum]|uniref:E4 SUMO-protein ligase PIAL2-like n=1 Tax=Solanum stenotomum TaxID=172797 RepID=UPI0020D0AC9B|nr:E4 SUMO-protein ligase PIAL2-like [Solanum stenotomum]